MSKVEQVFVDKSIYQVTYEPDEKVRIVVVKNFPELGKLTALRFLEWVQQNSGGVISLPTGKTPEHFIYWVKHYLANWESCSEELSESGINVEVKPDMRSLTFVQMDDFYPLDSSQGNSFCNYVTKYYINGFGMDLDKALLIDCNKIGLGPDETLDSIWPDGSVDLTLRAREPANRLEERQKEQIIRVDAWCDDFESKIKELGGIGFFLGGIGPDGHIAFNIRGSSHYSPTRMVFTNYETQAAAASDLGGIEVASAKPVITIGLGTITYNKNCTAIIMAAGEAKAEIVTSAITGEPDIAYPQTALQKLPNSSFFLTKGAAKLLKRRLLVRLQDQNEIQDSNFEHAFVDLALTLKKPILQLTEEEIRADAVCSLLLKKKPDTDLEKQKQNAFDMLSSKIQIGISDHSKMKFLHTEPHHDDIMLGYQPALIRDLHNPGTEHYFTTATSGFTAVTNYCLRERVNDSLNLLKNETYDPNMSEDEEVHTFIFGLASKSNATMRRAHSLRFIRSTLEIFGLSTQEEVKAKLEWVLEYIESIYPGKKDVTEIQTLKGSIREWEVECLWGTFGIRCEHVHHLRLAFYSGDLFTVEPNEEQDLPPILDLISQTKPDVMTICFDPEASGPDTHYKVMQAFAGSIRSMQKSNSELLPKEIWGYRNVWFRFHASDANIMVPVTFDDLTVMHRLFMESFVTQRDASFPSHEHDGPFSELSQSIQADQFRILQTCLGKEWFLNHENPRIRAACGFVFMKRMDVNEFLGKARKLKKLAENR